MARNERQTCKDLIEPGLKASGWTWDEQLHIGPGRVNLTGEAMYDETQSIIADYLLRFKSVPLAILEAKAESEDAADGMQQGSRYARRLSLRFSVASNGKDWILTDNDTGNFETLESAPSPESIIGRMGVTIDWPRWEGAFAAGYHVDQVSRKRVRPYQDIAINKTLWQFAQGNNRVLLLMATGTGKTFTVFQLAWKLLNGKALKREHVLFLTDRNSLPDASGCDSNCSPRRGMARTCELGLHAPQQGVAKLQTSAGNIHLPVARIRSTLRSVATAQAHIVPAPQCTFRRGLPRMCARAWICASMVGSEVRDRLPKA